MRKKLPVPCRQLFCIYGDEYEKNKKPGRGGPMSTMSIWPLNFIPVKISMTVLRLNCSSGRQGVI